MPLAEFDRVTVDDASRYELAKGVIEVSDVPGRVHQLVLQEVRKQFTAYELRRDSPVRFQGGGSEAKVFIAAYESERHPDWAVYLTPMPEMDQPWEIWQPHIVLEIVSESSIKRDYEDKPQEYLALGIHQYWILDPIRKQLLIKTNRGGLWADKVYKPSQKVTTLILTGFVFDLRRALAAAK